MTRLLVTCEHGGNRIPARYRSLFSRHRAALDSHRGYDPGALALARELARALDAELVYSTTSRLLIELNRSPHHPQLFSVATRDLPVEEKERLMQRYYQPYREWVEAQVAAAIGRGERVVHVSSHSFTPRLDGEQRRADIGLLYDPRRSAERALCSTWQRELRAGNEKLVVRRNYPYRGYADGLTTHLRRKHPDPAYAGIELEVNQKYPLGNGETWRELRALVTSTAPRVLAGDPPGAQRGKAKRDL